MIKTILVLFLIYTDVGFSQISTKELPLWAQASANTKKFFIDSELAFAEAQILLEKSVKSKDRKAELILLKNHCIYYELKGDFKNLLLFAEQYKEKARVYKNSYNEVLSYIYLSHSYAFVGLEDKVIEVLNRGLVVLEKSELDSTQKILLKGRYFTEFANIHFLKEDPEGQIKYVLLTKNEYDKVEDTILRRQLRFANYSHLASSYMEYDLDSARFYAQKSIELAVEDALASSLMFMNYLVLGVANKADQNYERAFYYFNKAEDLKENKNFLNVEELYKQIIETLILTGDTLEANRYTIELNKLKLEVSENKNLSLHKIIEKTAIKNRSRLHLIILGSSAIVIFILVVYFRRKNKLLALQELKSQEYLEEQLTLLQEHSYKELIEAIKKNDPAFMFIFQQTFPNFSEKLVAIYPEITKSELEFCALIKLKLTTKEIARYKMIHFRTVQNRKYRIRKKLNLPAEVDIYDWFRDF